MLESRKILLARAATVTVVVGLGVIATLVRRGLFADGAFFFLLELEPGGVSLFDQTRIFAQFLNQFPVLISIKLGLEDFELITILHSAGLILVPTGFWLAALFLNIKTRMFWYLVLGYSVTFLVSGFFAVGEYNVTYGVVAFAFSMLVAKKIGWFGYIAIIFSSIALTRSYESMVFLGPFLFAVALIRFTRTVKDVNKFSIGAFFLAVASFFFAISAIFALLAILNPRNPGNAMGAADFQGRLLYPTSLIIIFCLASLLVGALLRSSGMQNILLSVVVIGIVLYLCLPSLWLSPEENYFMRVLSGIFLFVVLGLAYSAYLWPNRFRPNNFFLTLVSFSLFVGLAIPQLVDTFRWSKWAEKYSEVVQTITTWVPAEDTALAEDTYAYGRFLWHWTNPSMSLILRGNQNGGILNNPDSLYNPYSPESGDTDPTLKFRSTKLKNDFQG